MFVALCCHVDVIMPCSFFQDVDDEEGSYNDVPVGILCREQENITPHTQSLHHNASSVGIILDGNIVMDVESLPQAMYIVFGLTYALHLNYPKYMKNTFDCTSEGGGESMGSPYRYLLCYFFHPPVLSSFILTRFFVFPCIHLVFVNVKMPVFSRAEFYLASLSTKFEEAQYNIVMIGGKEEEIFFSFHAITEETTY